MTPRSYGPAAAYCPRCGAPLPGAPPTECAGCGYRLFVNARPTASLIIVDGTGFLALKRAAEPRAGLWETPGGFCDGWEHPADAAAREGREELGTEVILGDFVGMYVGSYEYQGETLPVLDAYFFATVTGHIVLDPAESSDLKWFDLAKPPPLAFPGWTWPLGTPRDVWGSESVWLLRPPGNTCAPQQQPTCEHTPGEGGRP